MYFIFKYYFHFIIFYWSLLVGEACEGVVKYSVKNVDTMRKMLTFVYIDLTTVGRATYI